MHAGHFIQRSFFSIITIVIVNCALPKRSSAQAVRSAANVNVPNKETETPVPQTAAAAHETINTNESNGKALGADATTQLAVLKNAEAELEKANAVNTAYVAGLNNFAKNDVAPYNDDLKNYTAFGTKFSVALAAYNKAAQANNALPAKKRKATTVDSLNKQKAQLDASTTKLSIWKNKLDAAKNKLDVKNQALQKQKQQYGAASLSATLKIKASYKKLASLRDQLAQDEANDNKCRDLLATKFNEPKPDVGYFSSPEYNVLMARVNAELAKTKNLAGSGLN